jgi:hypothetical protein
MDKRTLPRLRVSQLSDKQENKPRKLGVLQYKIPTTKSTKSLAIPGVSVSCVTSSLNGEMSCSPGDMGQMAIPSVARCPPVQPEARNRKKGRPQVKASGPSERAQSLHGARDDEPQPRPQHPGSCNLPAVILPQCKFLNSFLETGSCYVVHTGLEFLPQPPKLPGLQVCTTCAELPNFLST